MQITSKRLSQISIGITLFIALLVFIFGSPGLMLSAALIFIAGPILLLVISFLVGVVSVWLGMEMVNEDAPAHIQQDTLVNKELNILEYGSVIGKLDGEDCFDYLIIQTDDEQKSVKLEYVGPYNEDDGFSKLEAGWFVVFNDVLYTEPKDNIESIDSVL